MRSVRNMGSKGRLKPECERLYLHLGYRAWVSFHNQLGPTNHIYNIREKEQEREREKEREELDWFTRL